MFRGVIASAKSAVTHLVVKYLARASVALPFVIGGGFALAAVTLMLADRFGSLTAYWTMATALGLVGIVAGVTSVRKGAQRRCSAAGGGKKQHGRDDERHRRSGHSANTDRDARRPSHDAGRSNDSRERHSVACAQSAARRAAGFDRRAVLADTQHCRRRHIR
jgi:hypothetical protein